MSKVGGLIFEISDPATWETPGTDQVIIGIDPVTKRVTAKDDSGMLFPIAGGASFLGKKVDFDLNSGSAQSIGECPTGFYAYPTIALAVAPDGAVTTAVVELGWDTGAPDDVVSPVAIVLADSDSYRALAVRSGAKRGTPGDILEGTCTVLEGSARECAIYVFGYVVPV